MTDQDLRQQALDEAMKADPAQIYTSPACLVEKHDDGYVSVQVWVGFKPE